MPFCWFISILWTSRQSTDDIPWNDCYGCNNQASQCWSVTCTCHCELDSFHSWEKIQLHDTLGEDKFTLMLGPMHTENMILVMLGHWLNGSGCTAALTNSGIVSVCVVCTVIHWCIAFDMYNFAGFFFPIFLVCRLWCCSAGFLIKKNGAPVLQKTNHLPFSGLQVLTI